MKKLSKVKAKYDVDNPTDTLNKMSYLDEVFPSIDLEQTNRIDTFEIRDIFYEFFVHMFKNYEKYFNWKKKKEKKTKAATEKTTSFRPTLPLSWIVKIPRGWRSFFTSFSVCFDKTTQRITFIPPAVEPEHPPINIRSKIKIVALEDHNAKSAEANF